MSKRSGETKTVSLDRRAAKGEIPNKTPTLIRYHHRPVALAWTSAGAPSARGQQAVRIARNVTDATDHAVSWRQLRPSARPVRCGSSAVRRRLVRCDDAQPSAFDRNPSDLVAALPVREQRDVDMVTAAGIGWVQWDAIARFKEQLASLQ